MEVARKINELRAGNQVETNAWEYREEAEKTVTDLADIMVRSHTGIMQRLCYSTCLMWLETRDCSFHLISLNSNERIFCLVLEFQFQSFIYDVIDYVLGLGQIEVNKVDKNFYPREVYILIGGIQIINIKNK